MKRLVRSNYDRIVVSLLFIAAALCIAAILKGQQKPTTTTSGNTPDVVYLYRNPQPTTFIIAGPDNKPIITIHQNGRIEWRDGMTPEQAAKEFADGLEYYVGLKWGCQAKAQPPPQLLNHPSYECRFVYRRADAIVKTGDWSSGHCAESLVAMDLYNASAMRFAQPDVSVTTEIRSVGEPKLKWGETKQQESKR